jgi:hypothetical protein
MIYGLDESKSDGYKISLLVGRAERTLSDIHSILESYNKKEVTK